jgi:hypothetical protein
MFYHSEQKNALLNLCNIVHQSKHVQSTCQRRSKSPRFVFHNHEVADKVSFNEQTDEKLQSYQHADFPASGQVINDQCGT